MLTKTRDKFVVENTDVPVEDIKGMLEDGKSDSDILRKYPELLENDILNVRRLYGIWKNLKING